MPTVQRSAHDLANRRMVTGLLLSLLAHALILSIGFGLPGLRAGGTGPITVSLAPLPRPAPAGELPPAPAEPAPSLPSASPLPVTQRTPGSGFRVFDPIPLAPPPAASQTPEKPTRRRRPPRPVPPRPDVAPTPVIAQQDHPDAAFKVPLADEQAETVPETPVPEQPAPLVAEPMPEPDSKSEQRVAEHVVEDLRVEQQREDQEGARRLAEAREAEHQRLAEQQRAQERTEALQRQAEQEQRQELARQREEAAITERLANERAAEARRLQEQLRKEEALRERLVQDDLRARELAEQRVLAEEQARATAAREAERLAADEAARRLAAERERVARQLAEEAARERAQQLALRQEEEERVRRQHAEQVAAQAARDERARREAQERVRQQAAEAERARQIAQGQDDTGIPGMSPGKGAGAGGTLPRGSLDGVGLASRARELMRGIDLPGTPPAALRPAQQTTQGRRRVVDTLERDVPLRLYVDSFRQKIERNAAQIRMQVAGGPGRADPLVSVALRSDGSVDDVTIVRSSGRPDLDEAVRRIVRLNARYAAFPPNVAARFDVIEIRRIWLFAENLKLLEEVR